MSSDLTSNQQLGHSESGPQFKASSGRLEKWGIDLVIPALVVHHVIPYTMAASHYKEG